MYEYFVMVAFVIHSIRTFLSVAFTSIAGTGYCHPFGF